MRHAVRPLLAMIHAACVLGYAVSETTDVCWKGSYGRGVGRPIHSCAPPLEQSGALCYPKCHEDDPSYTGVGPVCWQKCRDGYIDEGALCRKKGSIETYAKKSYGRGAGVPLGCAHDEEYDAGLCYKPCPSGKPHGVGPVCWTECAGSRPYDGTALCCTDEKTCNDKILALVAGVPEAVAAAILGGHDPASILKDIKASIDAFLGYIMPICPDDK